MMNQSVVFLLFFFFFNDTATTEIYTLSLHDALRDLPAEARRDVVDAEDRRLEPVLQLGGDLRLLGLRQLFRPDLEARVLPVGRLSAPLDDRVALAELARSAAHLLERLGLLRREVDLRAALEVDAEIQAADGERADSDRHDGGRDPEPDVALAHEVDLQPLRSLRS